MVVDGTAPPGARGRLRCRVAGGGRDAADAADQLGPQPGLATAVENLHLVKGCRRQRHRVVTRTHDRFIIL